MPEPLACPRCSAELTDSEVQSLNARRVSAKRTKRGGWPKGRPRNPLAVPESLAEIIEHQRTWSKRVPSLIESEGDVTDRERVYDYTEVES